MNIQVNGTRLWFDVEGAGLAPDGPRMRPRPTVLAIHGGPAGYDHSYLKPHLGRLTEHAQVVYVDLRGHGRSEHGDAGSWSLEACADDLRAFCDRLGIVRPLLFGHSMGGFVALVHALRHPGRAGALLLQATAARHDPRRIVAAFRARFDAELADIAARAFTSSAPLAREDARRCLRAFGPCIPTDDVFERIVPNPDLRVAVPRLATFDVVDQLGRIEVPTLVSVGALDPVTPVAAAQEIVTALPDGVGQLEVLEDVGHFPWLDDPERYWPHVERFVERVAAASLAAPAPDPLQDQG